MTLLPSGIFCANSVNYLSFFEPNINVKYILSLLNSSLINYVFKISSTNSNVNSYEVDALPIIIADIKTQKYLADLADNLILQKQANNQDIMLLKQIENQINHKVYELYQVNEEEQKIIESK